MGLFSDPFINWRRIRLYAIIAAAVWAVTIFLYTQENRPAHKRVILFVIDGLRADIIPALGENRTPNFHYLIRTGASTFNARTDLRNTETLPNAVSMLTGRPVFDGPDAHKYLLNAYVGKAIHDVKDAFVKSVFDVIFDYDLRSSFFASKDKFGLFVKSYTTNERKKKHRSRFQSYFISERDDALTFKKFMVELKHLDAHFIFLHLAGPDTAGHQYGWDIGTGYTIEVMKMDAYLGEILKTIQSYRHLRDNTYLIVTTDHGGEGQNHTDAFHANNYTIPFFVWGPGVAQGADLYALNKDTRRDPKKHKIPFESRVQPIRNSDAANLVLDLLELPPVPDSVINFRQNLKVRP